MHFLVWPAGVSVLHHLENNLLSALVEILPGGVGVTCVSEVGEGWGESSSPVCREKRGDLSVGVKVEQAVSKDAGMLH